MTNRRSTPHLILIPCILLTMTTLLLASRAVMKSLAERVRAAEAVFVATVTDKVTDGDWVRADLLVEKPLLNAERGKRVAVIWRATIGGRPIYNTAEGSRGIAILKGKHKGRYWLRVDKFEDLSKLAQVKKLVKAIEDAPRQSIK